MKISAIVILVLSVAISTAIAAPSAKLAKIQHEDKQAEEQIFGHLLRFAPHVIGGLLNGGQKDQAKLAKIQNKDKQAEEQIFGHLLRFAPHVIGGLLNGGQKDQAKLVKIQNEDKQAVEQFLPALIGIGSALSSLFHRKDQAVEQYNYNAMEQYYDDAELQDAMAQYYDYLAGMQEDYEDGGDKAREQFIGRIFSGLKNLFG